MCLIIKLTGQFQMRVRAGRTMTVKMQYIRLKFVDRSEEILYVFLTRYQGYTFFGYVREKGGSEYVLLERLIGDENLQGDLKLRRIDRFIQCFPFEACAAITGPGASRSQYSRQFNRRLNGAFNSQIR